ncbi:hypothetical protein QT971_10840 [Microcoleus sp. herbarium19]|uniref:hypothetical protein n=1 Tax=unclassified Microcoleus TaxID=2642155 RepID=UPI002FD29CF7
MPEQVKKTELPQASAASSPEASPAIYVEEKESESPQASSVSDPKASMEWLVLEIDKIPQEYWPNLLEIIRLYGESVRIKGAQQDSWEKIKEEMNNPDPVVELARQKALSEMLRSWREDGDEQEQKETGDYLRQALDEDRLSNRELFPHE